MNMYSSRRYIFEYWECIARSVPKPSRSWGGLESQLALTSGGNVRLKRSRFPFLLWKLLVLDGFCSELTRSVVKSDSFWYVRGEVTFQSISFIRRVSFGDILVQNDATGIQPRRVGGASIGYFNLNRAIWYVSSIMYLVTRVLLLKAPHRRGDVCEWHMLLVGPFPHLIAMWPARWIALRLIFGFLAPRPDIIRMHSVRADNVGCC